MTSEQQNPLAVDKISSLILRFSVPSIIAMLVSAVYNIADQLFIGNAVGTLGNAATNIAFPLAMMCTGLGLLFGIGGGGGLQPAVRQASTFTWVPAKKKELPILSETPSQCFLPLASFFLP